MTLIYLDQALNEVRQRRLIQALALSRADVRRAITTGAVKRLGPKMMLLIACRHGCGRTTAVPQVLSHRVGRDVTDGHVLAYSPVEADRTARPQSRPLRPTGFGGQ